MRDRIWIVVMTAVVAAGCTKKDAEAPPPAPDPDLVVFRATGEVRIDGSAVERGTRVTEHVEISIPIATRLDIARKDHLAVRIVGPSDVQLRGTVTAPVLGLRFGSGYVVTGDDVTATLDLGDRKQVAVGPASAAFFRERPMDDYISLCTGEAQLRYGEGVTTLAPAIAGGCRAVTATTDAVFSAKVEGHGPGAVDNLRSYLHASAPVTPAD